MHLSQVFQAQVSRVLFNPKGIAAYSPGLSTTLGCEDENVPNPNRGCVSPTQPAKQTKPIQYGMAMNKISWWDRARQFREELDAVADVNWLHPAWQTIVWGSAFLQRSDQATTDAMQTYRSANGGPHSDTFMAWPARQSGPLTHRVARAVVGAIVATQQLGLLQPRLKGQILQACLQWESGWLNPRGLDDRDTANAVFITPQGTFLGRAEPSKAETIGLALYRLLAEGLRLSRRVLQAIDPQDAATVRAAVAVSLFQQSAPGCRHLHRFGWSRGVGALAGDW